MKIRSKYKIARRYGGDLFEKTSTQKFALRQGARATVRPRAKSDFAVQLAEKQRARFLYGLSDRQLRALSRRALAHRQAATEAFFSGLELRLDNAAYRAGLAPTRSAARQLVSHGHLAVNGVRVNVPSYLLKEGDHVTVRPRSVAKKLWSHEKEAVKETMPSWLVRETGDGASDFRVTGKPVYVRAQSLFNIDTVLEFYRR